MRRLQKFLFFETKTDNLKKGGNMRLLFYLISGFLVLSACSREETQVQQLSSTVQKKVQSSTPSIDEPKRMFQ